jgi:predicted dehydrogenase
MIRIGVIGYGYWGPNTVRNLQALDSTRVAAVCDSNPEGQRRAKHAFPDVQVTSDAVEVLRSPSIDAVGIVTPVWTHFELVLNCRD